MIRRNEMKFFTLLFLFALYLNNLFAAERHPITFEDFFAMKRIGNVAVSPDGRKVAYDVKVPDIEQNNFKTNIWILDPSSGKSFRLTNGDVSSNGPVWTVDGKSIYFNRKGQVWKIRIDGGEATQVTHFATGAWGTVFDGQGQHMLFASEVFPDCRTEECNQQRLEAKKKSKVKARIIDHLFYRHWNRWLNGKRSHVFLANMDGGNIKDMTPGDYDTPPLDLGSDHDYTFSPDGKEICFVRNTDAMVAASTNNDLFIGDVASGTIHRLTTNKGDDAAPHYSPDGRYIAFTSMKRPGFEADRQRLMLYDRKNKSFRELTGNFTLSVTSLVWHPSGKEIFFTVAENGSNSIYKVNIRSGKTQPILKGHFVAAVQFLNKNELIFKEQAEDMPYEIFKLNLKNHQRVQLTHLNTTRLARLQLSKLRPFSFKGAKGDLVHGFIMTPPNFDPAKKYPAIELIHGGPQGEWGNDFHYRWNYQMFAAPGYVVFMINFHGSRGYGQKFTDAVSKDWGGAPYEDIMIGTQYVLGHYPFIDKDRVGAAGASYGGFMINWIAGADNPFQCLVCHDGVYDQVSMYGATEELWFPEWEFNGTPWDSASLYRKWSPSRPDRVIKFKTPTLVIHSEHDFRVPYTQGMQMFTALQRQGIKSKLLFFPDEDHFVRKPQNARLWWKTVHEWFAEFLMN